MTTEQTQISKQMTLPSQPAPLVADKLPFEPPRLTHHGRVSAVTQHDIYPAVFQGEIVAETSP